MFEKCYKSLLYSCYKFVIQTSPSVFIQHQILFYWENIWATTQENVTLDNLLTFQDFKVFRKSNLSKVKYILFD